MKRPVPTLSLMILGVTFGLFLSPSAFAAKRPNFVWILSEDNSIDYLRLYGHPLGITPAIEKLAAQGIIFDHAFSCGPVCSVARTTLMTGVYAPRAGFQYHRKSVLAHLPGGLRMWPFYLRQAGYYTTNNAKKDYNVVEGEGVWDASSRRASWRNRPSKDTPFFHMQTTTVSHESSLHFTANEMNTDVPRTSPDEVVIAPYHPDTATFRYTYARYFDRIRLVDKQVAKLVKKLEEDGLLADTFIFYFGDHGGVLPRSKGYLYETGLHVPLVVRIPKNWTHRVALPLGSRNQGFVSFVDFGPTLLNLAGLPVPAEMDGKPFLGNGVSAAALSARDETVGYADRFDEKYDLCRSLRKGRFKYIRNYQAFYPDGLQNNYRYRMLAYQEWRRLYRAGKLNPIQRRFFEPRPAEMLFDIEVDPYEIRNLARQPGYAGVLKDLRRRLKQRVKGWPDLSFYPESEMVEHLDDGAAYGTSHLDEIGRLVDAADLSLLPFKEAKKSLRDAIKASDPWERYWALIACSVFGEKARSLAPDVERLVSDPALLVRVRAAEFLGVAGVRDPRPTLYGVLNQTHSPLEALITLNTAVFFQDRTHAYPFDLSKLHLRVAPQGEITRRLAYLGKK